MPRIEDANALSLSTYQQRYLPASLDKVADEQHWNVKFESSSTISSIDFDTCLSLIANSSSKAYATSSTGWSPAKKRKEMKLPDLHYLLLSPNTKSQIQGFLSFMMTYEDGHEVVYCYELHLVPSLHGKGLGRHLMSLMEGAGMKVGVEKSMLTVFTENQSALAFYSKLGYSKDEYSPEPRKLRNGAVKDPGYVILSKPLRGMEAEEAG
ncbi:MAG: hypothetical protein Q9183_007182 [Haloplaca sp. 2 TL-2023]